jgi:hypothetical protein
MNAPTTTPRRRIQASGFPYRPGERPLPVDRGETGIAGVTWRRSNPVGQLVLESVPPRARRKLWELLQAMDPETAEALTAARPIREQLAAAFGPLETLLPFSHPAVKALRDDYRDRGAELDLVTRIKST